MKNTETVYRCNRLCPIGKHCFIIKVKGEIKEPICVHHKCPAEKHDIPINIGGDRMP